MMRVLIVDDEPLAREGLMLRLAGRPDVQIVGQCTNGTDAIRTILDQSPDLVFLDIRMPRLSGFDVVEAVGPDRMPLVVFLTAYDEHAVAAFEVNALDYLLKPLEPERLEASLVRATEELTKRNVAQRARQLRDLLDDPTLAKERRDDQRIVVRSGGHVHLLRASEITWVEASGDYVTIHTIGKAHLLRETMRRMERRLKVSGFRRVHRSAIVNLEHVTELIANESGDYHIVLADGTRLKLSRSYRDELYTALNA